MRRPPLPGATTSSCAELGVGSSGQNRSGLDHRCDNDRCARNSVSTNAAICKLAQHMNDTDKAFR